MGQRLVCVVCVVYEVCSLRLKALAVTIVQNCSDVHSIT